MTSETLSSHLSEAIDLPVTIFTRNGGGVQGKLLSVEDGIVKLELERNEIDSQTGMPIPRKKIKVHIYYLMEELCGFDRVATK